MPLWLYQYLHRRSKAPYVPKESANHGPASSRESDLTLNKGRIHPLQAAFVIAAALWGLHSSILISFPNPPYLIPPPQKKKKFQAFVGLFASPWASHRLPQADWSLAVIETFLRGITSLAPLSWWSDSSSASQHPPRPTRRSYSQVAFSL